MSLTTPIGPELNILEPCSEQCERLVIEQPILSLEDLFVLKNIKYRNFKVRIPFRQIENYLSSIRCKSF
jgi:hypothetical protein